MPKYEKPNCPKCGFHPLTQYFETSHSLEYVDGKWQVGEVEHQETVEILCTSCGYYWRYYDQLDEAYEK